MGARCLHKLWAPSHQWNGQRDAKGKMGDLYPRSAPKNCPRLNNHSSAQIVRMNQSGCYYTKLVAEGSPWCFHMERGWAVGTRLRATSSHRDLISVPHTGTKWRHRNVPLARARSMRIPFGERSFPDGNICEPPWFLWETQSSPGLLLMEQRLLHTLTEPHLSSDRHPVRVGPLENGPSANLTLAWRLLPSLVLWSEFP